MSQTIKLKKGFDINLAGKAKEVLEEGVRPDTYAIKPTDFLGMSRPKLHVAQGDTVKAGTPILYDKLMDQVQYVAPVSGEIVEIKRGEKRKLLEVKILADKELEYESFDDHSISDIKNLTREDVIVKLSKGGVWPNIIQRPYGIVADPSDEPKAIFVSTFDSHPLAPNLGFTLKGEEAAFQAGVEILKKLTPGLVHVNINGNAEVEPVFTNIEGVEINKISGPHPAGNVGVQIHHIHPISKGDLVWTVSPQGLVRMGRLLLEGKYDASTVIAVTGDQIKDPKYYKTIVGACVDKFLENNIVGDHVRVISGNVLTGEKLDKTGYLGFYQNHLTVIKEGDYHEFLGWILPTTNKLSFHRAFGLLSFLSPKKEYSLDTNTRGQHRAFVASGVFEKVTPMDVLPTYLMKAILAEDYDEMEALGIYELIEEDLALCEFVDVSKNDIQALLRQGIELIRES